MVRVAALEFAESSDADEHLTRCLRVIDKAARLHAPKLMVLPAQGALRLDGPFLRAMAAAAADHGSVIVVHALLEGESGTSPATLLYDERGELLRADADGSPVLEARFGRLGALLARDAQTMDAARSLALRGAQVLALSAGASPAELCARAAENRVFAVVAAGGDSTIVGPDGRVLARAEPGADGIVTAELELAEAEHKLRPDGTHLFALRRPELYRALSSRARPHDAVGASNLSAALLAPELARGPDGELGPEGESVDAMLSAAAESLAELAREGVELVVMPELFYLPGGKVEFPAAAADLFVSVVRRVAEACAGTPLHVVTSAVEKVGAELFHMGLVIGARGVVARQPQLHVPMRHAWATAGRRFDTFRLPWGRLAIAVGDDLSVPELLKAYALSGVEVVAAPFGASEAWELSLGAAARAAENRLCVAVAARSSELGASALHHPLERDAEGRVVCALVQAEPGSSVVRAQVSLLATHDKHSGDDNLLELRPVWSSADLTRRGLGVPEQRRAEQLEEPAAAPEAETAPEPEPAAEPTPEPPSEDAGEG
jgi:predicted amidohydrolase